MYAGSLDTFGKTGKAVSIRGKPKNDYSTIAPGPGAYNSKAEFVKANSQQYKMSRAERGNLLSKSLSEQPGPGMYSGDIHSFGKGAAAVTIGGKYKQDYSTVSPGPGAYNAALAVIKEQGRSMSVSQSERRTLFA